MVMNVSIDKFTTHRLVAERILLSHFSDICRLHSDSQVMKTLSADGNVLDDEATRTGLQQGIEHWQQQGYGMWVFRDKQNKQFIGRAGLKQYSFDGGIEIGLAYAVLSDLLEPRIRDRNGRRLLGYRFQPARVFRNRHVDAARQPGLATCHGKAGIPIRARLRLRRFAAQALSAICCGLESGPRRTSP